MMIVSGLPSHWEHFEHQADIGIRGYGYNLSDAFWQAALAMSAVITESEQVEAQELIEIHCNESDPELLLVDWLNAVIYEMATRKMLFCRYEVDIDRGQLQASAWGERVDQIRHKPVVEVKGATYTELDVHKREDGVWVAHCVIDV